MRSILLATILAASTLVTNVRTADACGGGGSYEWHPTAHAIATPSGNPERGASFALMWERLDQKSGATVKLARLDTMSFDHSTSAFNRSLPDATRLTLLGPSGTKLFEASSTVWLDLAYDKEGAREAVELPKGQFVVALAGHFKDATWTDLQVIHGSTITSFRADKLHFTIHHGGDRSFVLNGLRMKGYPLGIVTVRKARYLAVAIGDSHTDMQLVKI
jgi:hypothetical protein